MAETDYKYKSPRKRLLTALLLFLIIGLVVNYFTTLSQQRILEERIRFSDETRARVERLESQIKDVQLKLGISPESTGQTK